MPSKHLTVTILSMLTVAFAGTLATIYPAQLMTPKPVTITLLEKQYRHPTGEYVDSKTLVTAVRADGSSVTVRQLQSSIAAVGPQRIIVDLANGRKTIIEPITRSITTAILRPDTVDGHRRRFASCMLEDVARSVYQGYTVVKQVRQQTSDCRNGDQNCKVTVRSESWRAPDLNCSELKRVDTLSMAGEAPVLVTSIEAQSVEVGEPDSRLFEVPQNYTERTRSEVGAELSRIKGESHDAEVGRMLDEAHRSSQRPPTVKPVP